MKSNRFLYLLPLLTLAILAGFFGWSLVSGRDPASIGSALVGRPAPTLKAPALRPGEAALTDALLRTGKPTIVNFFASWCTPCITEHRELIAFDEAHRADGDAALISVTYDNEADDARAFFAQRGGGWPVIDDPDNRIGVAYGVAQVPESFVISPDGIVVVRFAGAVTRADLDEVIDFYEGGSR